MGSVALSAGQIAGQPVSARTTQTLSICSITSQTSGAVQTLSIAGRVVGIVGTGLAVISHGLLADLASKTGAVGIRAG